MASLSSEQVQALEDLRQRLSALSGNLQTLHNRFGPSARAADIQGAATSVSSSLNELNTELAKHEDLLARTIVYPNGKFPANTAAAVPEHLLSTHLSLPVQEWIESGQQAAEEATAKGLLSDSDRAKLWATAPNIALQEARKQKWGQDYTLAEVQGGVEAVVTGLKRELIVPEQDDDEDMEDDEDEEDDDDEEDAAEAMEVDGNTAQTRATNLQGTNISRAPPTDLVDILYFASTGREIDAATKRRLLPVK